MVVTMDTECNTTQELANILLQDITTHKNSTTIKKSAK